MFYSSLNSFTESWTDLVALLGALEQVEPRHLKEAILKRNCSRLKHKLMRYNLFTFFTSRFCFSFDKIKVKLSNQKSGFFIPVVNMHLQI